MRMLWKHIRMVSSLVFMSQKGFPEEEAVKLNSEDRVGGLSFLRWRGRVERLFQEDEISCRLVNLLGILFINMFCTLR